jgi:hypothetical protein
MDSDRWELLFDPGSLAHIYHLMAPAMYAGMCWTEEMMPNLLFGGNKSTAKSHTMKAFKKQLSPGCSDLIAHKTDMANTTGTFRDLKNEFIEEASGVLIGGSGPNREAQVASKGNQVNKARLTNPIVETHTLQIKDGVRTHGVYISSNLGLMVAATNEQLPPEDDPTRARFITVMFDTVAEGEDSIANKIDQLDQPESDQFKREALRTRVLLHFYIILFEIYIYCRVVENVQMDAYTMYTQRFCDKMALCGFTITDPKKRVQLRSIARSATLAFAIEMGMMSPVGRALRVNAQGNYVDYFDRAVRLIEAVQVFCVTTLPICVHTYSVCKELWANELSVAAISAARNMTIGRFTEMFDDSCYGSDDKDVAGFRRTNDPDGGAFEDTEEFKQQLDGTQFVEDVNPDNRKKGGDNDDDDDDGSDGGDEGNQEPLQEVDADLAARMNKIDLTTSKRLVGNATTGNVPISDDERTHMRNADATSSSTSTSTIADPEPKRGAKRHARELDPKAKINAFLGLFRTTYPFENKNHGVPDACYVEVKGSEMGLSATCSALVSNAPGKGRSSKENMMTVMESLSRTEIDCPRYDFERGTFRVVATDERVRIPPVLIVYNTALLDPNHHGSSSKVRRVYFALHVLLNNHSLASAIINSVRSMGYVGFRPRDCIINIPVNSRAYRVSETKTVGRPVVMHGVYRVVRIAESREHFVFRQPRSYPMELLLSVSSTTLRKTLLPESVSALAREPAFIISSPPEAVAARRLLMNAGFPADTPLLAVPETLDFELNLLRRMEMRGLEDTLDVWQSGVELTYPIDKMRAVFAKNASQNVQRLVGQSSRALRSTLQTLGSASESTTALLPSPDRVMLHTAQARDGRRGVRDMFVDMLDDVMLTQYNALSASPVERYRLVMTRYERAGELRGLLQDFCGISADSLFADDTAQERAEDASGVKRQRQTTNEQVDAFVGKLSKSIDLDNAPVSAARLAATKTTADFLSTQSRMLFSTPSSRVTTAPKIDPLLAAREQSYLETAQRIAKAEKKSGANKNKHTAMFAEHDARNKERYDYLFAGDLLMPTTATSSTTTATTATTSNAMQTDNRELAESPHPAAEASMPPWFKDVDPVDTDIPQTLSAIHYAPGVGANNNNNAPKKAVSALARSAAASRTMSQNK